MIFLLKYTFSATSKKRGSLYIEKPEEPPQENDGIKFLGKPLPKIFAPTPITVPVLNIVLIPHLE